MSKPTLYTLKDISNDYGRSHPTTCRHVQLLVAKRLFKKESIGRYYTEPEYLELARLMGFPPKVQVKKKPHKQLSLKWKS
jgi:DNA-binding IclR family transcriptional regulator